MEWQTWPPTSMWKFRSLYPMLRLKPPPRVLLIRTALWIGWTERYKVLLRMNRCSSRRNCPSAWLNLKLRGSQLVFRSSGNPSNSVWYISDIQRGTLWAIYQSAFGEWVLATISPPVFLNCYTSAMFKRHTELEIQSLTCHRSSKTMTGVPVFSIHSRHCLILPFKAGMILTPHKVWTYYPLPIYGKILAKPFFYAFSIVRKSTFSALYHNRYIIWEDPISAMRAAVSN